MLNALQTIAMPSQRLVTCDSSHFLPALKLKAIQGLTTIMNHIIINDENRYNEGHCNCTGYYVAQRRNLRNDEEAG